MPERERDPYGSTDSETAYRAQGRRGRRAGKARSAWAVALLAIFLVALAIWIVTGATDPITGGILKTSILRS